MSNWDIKVGNNVICVDPSKHGYPCNCPGRELEGPPRIYVVEWIGETENLDWPPDERIKYIGVRLFGIIRKQKNIPIDQPFHIDRFRKCQNINISELKKLEIPKILERI